MSATGKTSIVGIGASAGGLEALCQLVSRLDPDLPCAYVVLQHLSPSHRSMMVEILARETRLPVCEVTHGLAPVAGRIHVVPASHNVVLKAGQFELVAVPPETTPKPSINRFFVSLAGEEGARGVGIILSGTGTDGTAGLQAIRAAGGLTIVQSPETAKYDGMPRSAIDAGVADHVLAPDTIALRLAELMEGSHADGPVPSRNLVERLLGLLKEQLNIDFSGYKTGTLMRRIRRREAATGMTSAEAYLTHVEGNPEELGLLARDILISVTSFFRDRNAFEALRAALDDLVAHKDVTEDIRVWVAGCATGEEAYSLAILLAEALGDRLGRQSVQVFATDIDDDALLVARRGVYAANALRDMPADLVRRHFRQVKQSYEVAKHLRDMLVFARHNLVNDPPFLRLDLVSCRNVLIYFDAGLQAKVLRMFHFGLNRNGLLFLGRSESVAQGENLFLPADRSERIYSKSMDAAPRQQPSVPSGGLRLPMQRRDRRIEHLLAGIIDHSGLTALLCDGEGNVLHSVGEVGDFLLFPVGTTRFVLADLIIPELRGEVLTLLHKVGKQRRPYRSRTRRVNARRVRLHLRPVGEGSAELLLFLIEEERTGGSDGDIAAGLQLGDHILEDELLSTREHLHTLLEEMATSNEEMQVLNEESQASNEELQAANEELEASNEELQATNEELVSLNEEFNVKALELTKLTEEYAHLYDSLPFSILVFDRACHLVRFNATAAEHLRLTSHARGRHISQLSSARVFDTIGPALHRALTSLDQIEMTVEQEARIFQLTVTRGLDRQGLVSVLVVTLTDISEISLTQQRLRESQAQLSAVMESTATIFAMKSPTGAYLYANQRFLDLFGFVREECLGKTDFELFGSDVAADIWNADLEALRRKQTVGREHVLERDGERIYIEASHRALFTDSGRPEAVILEAEDVTFRKAAEEQLRITHRVFEQAAEAIVVTDAGFLVQACNPAFTTITGHVREEIVGAPLGELLFGETDPERPEALRQALADYGFWQGEVCNRRRNGESFASWLTINRVTDEMGRIEHFVALFSDITEVKTTQERTHYLSTHDDLTGLPNRAQFNVRLRQLLGQARRTGSRLALLFIDIDHFKSVNDTLGHDVGDRLLKTLADRLKRLVVREEDIARVGGDEFVIFASDCDARSVANLAQTVIESIELPVQVEESVLFVTTSIGAAFFPDDADDAESLVRAADSAMYQAKEYGRNRLEFFKPELRIRLLRRTTIEGALRLALAEGRLRLVYQPKCRLTADGAMVGAEALMRWDDPLLGTISPGEFIPIAERCGLIVELDRYAEARLLAEMQAWIAAGRAVPPVSLNVSPYSIRESDFAEVFLSRFPAHGIPPALVQIEITEGALLEQSGCVLNNLNALSEAGIRIAVDDFGIGYSSLSYLKKLPLSELKIDRTFVEGLGRESQDEAIARAILGLADALGLETVAEGIETDLQRNWLIAAGCPVGQGYLLARPMEAEDFAASLAGQEVPA